MKLHALIIFILVILSSFNSDKLIKKKGFLFIVNSEKEYFFFIESKDSVLSDKIFSNNSYRIFERLCTRSPNIYEFAHTSIGQKIKFDYISVYGDTSIKIEINFIYCDLELKSFGRKRKVKEKISGRIGDIDIKTINYVFNNQIEYLMPIKQNEVNKFFEELKNRYK